MFINPKQDLEHQPSWKLVVADPAAVLQCFRASLGDRIWNAAHLLFHNSITFNTFKSFYRHPLIHTKESLMQFTSSLIVPFVIFLTLTTTHNMKKFMIKFSLVLINGPLSLRVVLCGDLHCTLFIIQQTWSSSSLKVLQRMLSLEDVS